MNKVYKSNVDKYINWLNEQFPKYEIVNNDIKNKILRIKYDIKGIWTKSYYILIYFSDEGNVINSTEYKDKLVWAYNKHINKEELNEYFSDEEKEKLEELKREESLMIDEELKRTKIEKYNFAKIGKLKIIPLVIYTLALIFFIYNIFLFKVNNKELNDFVIPLLYFIIPLSFIELFYIDIVESWKKKYNIKIKLIDSIKYNLDDYILDNIYTDNIFICIFIYIIKFIYWVINILFILLLIKWILGFLFGLGFNFVTLLITILLLIIIYLLISKK